jgi:predicted permease
MSNQTIRAADSIGGGMLQDIRYAARVLRNSPVFTAAVTLSLALGIGANTAIFTLMNTVLWRTLPIAHPESLVVLTHGRGHSYEGGFSYQQYAAMRRQAHGLPELAAWSPVRLNVSIDGHLEPTIEGQLVSGGYFPLLGVRAIAGRAIAPDDDRVPNGDAVAMISYGYWKRRFALDASAIGRRIAISSTPFTIIGVTPPEFFGLEVGSSPDLFLPIMMQPAVMPDLENLLDRPIVYRTWLQLVTRIAPPATAAQAIAALQPAFLQEVPKGGKAGTTFSEDALAFAPAAAGVSNLRQEFSRPLFVLMGIVGLVLLIACANTASLLLARAASRGSEFGVRVALGAGRGRLIRQLLVESVMLAMLGGLCSVAIAVGAIRVLISSMSAGRSPIALTLEPDLRVLAFTTSVSLATGILFGLMPALRATRIDLTPALKSSSRSVRGGLRAGRLLCATQVALSLVLLIAAGLFVRSLQNLNGRNGTVNPDDVLIVRVEPKGSDQRNVPGATTRLDRIYQDLLARVAAVRGVDACSLAQFTPTVLRGNTRPFVLPSGAEKPALVPMIYPNYFDTMGIALIAGRDFDRADLIEGSPLVAVVNETFARQAFPGGSAVGQRLRQGAALREIVGVVRDSPYTNVRGEIQPIVYQTFLQTSTGRGQMALYVRISGKDASIRGQIRQAVQDIDRDLPSFEVRTLAEERGAVLMQERVITMLSTVFSALALLLACVGLYGLLAFSVVQRTAELGIRIALGASGRTVVWTVMREALLLVAIGVAIGVPAALAAARVASHQIAGLFFGVGPFDALTIVAATALLGAVAAGAGYVPARRASRVDPMIALRNE